MERKEDTETVLLEQYTQGKKAFASYNGGEDWRLLVPRELPVMVQLLPDKSVAFRGLDVTVLHSLVLEKMLGIDKQDMAQQINLTYTCSLSEALTSA